MSSYKNIQVSPYDPTELAIYSILCPEDDRMSNCGQNFKNTASFDDIVYFIDEEDIVTYVDFDFGITFHHGTATKIRQINREWNNISRSCKKPNCIPRNHQHNWFIVEQCNSFNFLKPYNFWDMVPAALMSLNHTSDRYSNSNQYTQPSIHQPRTDSCGVIFIASKGQ